VCSSYVLRVDKCVFCFITFFLACLFMRMTFKSIAGVPLRWDSADHPIKKKGKGNGIEEVCLKDQYTMQIKK